MPSTSPEPTPSSSPITPVGKAWPRAWVLLALLLAGSAGFVGGHQLGSRSPMETSYGRRAQAAARRAKGEARPFVYDPDAAPAQPGEPRPAGEPPSLPADEPMDDDEPPPNERPRPRPFKPAAPPASSADEAPLGPFDLDAAAWALSSLEHEIRQCNTTAHGGLAQISVTFAPSGHVTQTQVVGPPFAGTPEGSCMALKLRNARIPPFLGEAVTVRKNVASR